MKSNKTILLGLSMLMTTTAFAQQTETRFQSAKERTALIELYTSEGCSSCPPAESWLSRLQNSSGLWKDFSPVAFHVDYWNYLGWKDGLSGADFSERQRSYAQLWGSDQVYTPEFVRNGKEWHVSEGGLTASHEVAGVLTVTSTDKTHWRASFTPEKPSADASYEIHASLLTGGISSDVKAGENSGRRLNHDFAALKLVQATMTGEKGAYTGEFTVDMPGAGTSKTLALTVWVTRAGGLEPLQSTGGWLVPPTGK